MLFFIKHKISENLECCQIGEMNDLTIYFPAPVASDAVII